MCFASEAGFGVAAILVPAGIYCVRAALRKDRSYVGLAAIPLLFGVLGLSAGFTGSIPADGRLDGGQEVGIAIALFTIALAAAWIPFSAYLLESRPIRKKIFGGAAILGLGWFIALFAPLVADPGAWLVPRMIDPSIKCGVDSLPIFQLVSTSALRWLFTASVSVPLLFHEERRIVMFGAMMAASSAITYIIFPFGFVSIWCFVAGILSMYLCPVLANLEEPGSRPSLEPDPPAPAPAASA